MAQQMREEWIIHPFIGLGPLRFNTSRTTVRQALGDEFRSLTRWHRAGRRPETEAVDIYDALGVELRYDNDDTLVFIETFPPCEPTIDGLVLLGRNLDDRMAKLRRQGRVGNVGDIGCQYGD